MAPPTEQQRVLDKISTGPFLGLGYAAVDEQTQGKDEAPALQDHLPELAELARTHHQVAEDLAIGSDALHEDRRGAAGHWNLNGKWIAQVALFSERLLEILRTGQRRLAVLVQGVDEDPPVGVEQPYRCIELGGEVLDDRGGSPAIQDQVNQVPLKVRCAGQQVALLSQFPRQGVKLGYMSGLGFSHPGHIQCRGCLCAEHLDHCEVICETGLSAGHDEESQAFR